MTAPSVGRSQGRGDKYATGATKIRGRDNITIGTWNVRTLRPNRKLEELSYELDRYHWNIIGLSEARWKFHGEMCTDEGHKLYYSGSETKHEYGVGFIIHKDTVYAPTTSHGDDEMESFYSQVQTLVDETPKKDILVVLGDWNSKVGEDAQPDWKEVCGSYCIPGTNDRGLRLLNFATYNNLVLANTLGKHKASRRWTWYSPDGNHHNHIDYILIKKRFRSGVNVARTRSFPGADVGSDHDLVMMSFRVRLKVIKKPKQLRVKFDLEKLRDPDVAREFSANIGGKFAPLICMNDTDLDLDSLTDTFNTALTETASELLGKHRHVKKPWITKEVLELCDRRRELKEQQNKDKNGKCLVEEKEILSRWTEYCSDLYNYELQGDPSILDCPQSYPDNEESQPILREELEAAVKAMKKGKSPGIDNIPDELVQAAGDAAIDVLTKICNNIWKTGKWPTPWTQSLVITLPKKGNLQLCQNYCTISLPSKIMLRLILNRLKPLAENIIAEEQAGFRAGRSTT
ncbi:uncharacterized protein [Amphiura filiformis]|uniref:uncharacterized protein n=1 Tax=Amphiura filiformis TaxID=82378 RepID=UPI003B22512A